MRTPPLVIGHRGAPGYRPEHSRSSYELALTMGVDAVEPDVVPTKDGVLVVRHENEISGTTDVAEHPEFADRRATKQVDGESLTGWFTEDFTWAELSTLRCRERLGLLRPESAAFDDQEPILRLRDVLDLVRDGSRQHDRAVGIVLEIKHATYFASLGFDIASLVEAELSAAGWTDRALPLVIESFEQGVLDQLHARGIPAGLVYLVAGYGYPPDLVESLGDAAPTYRSQITREGLARLSQRVDGISVDKRIILASVEDAGSTGFRVRDASARTPCSPAADAHEAGLAVYTWTCRPENIFLDGRFRNDRGDVQYGDFRAEWALIRDAGVDGVFVDHPDLGVRFFRAEP